MHRARTFLSEAPQVVAGAKKRKEKLLRLNGESRLRVDDFVAVFAEDAIFEIDAVAGEAGVRNVGREVIRNWFLRWGQGAKDANPVHQAKFIRHHLSTCFIEITGCEGAWPVSNPTDCSVRILR